MALYYIKKYGRRELHRVNCVSLPIRRGMVKLGNFNSDEDALKKARTLFNKIDPCFTCCNVRKKKGMSKATN